MTRISHLTGFLAATALCGIASAQGVLITEVVDADEPGGLPKFVELTNTAASTVDLSGYALAYFTNGSTTIGGTFALTGMLSAGDSYVVSFENSDAPGVGVFLSIYGFDPDNFSFGAQINGDDTIALYLADGGGTNGAPTGTGADATLVDLYGVIGQDGTGQVWDYIDSYAFRCGDTPSTTFNPADWFIAGASALDTLGPAFLVASTSPGTWSSGMCAPMCADDAFEPNETCAGAASIGTGLTTGLNIDVGLEDWYMINVAAGDEIQVDFLFLNADGDVDLRLEAPCGTFRASSTSVSDNESATWTNTTGVAQDVFIRANRFGSEFCTPYDIDITVTTPPVCVPDAFEPNETCATAAPIGTGTTTGLNIDPGTLDFYSINLAAGDAIQVDFTFLHADGDVDLRLEAPCGTTRASSGSVTDNESASWTNTTGVAQDVVIRANRFGSQLCTPYDITIAITTPPSCVDDDASTNDTCATAQSISAGSSLRTVTDVSEDWYTISVADGDTVIFDVLFATVDGDIDLDLEGPCGTSLDSSGSTTDDEQVEWANTTGMAMDVKLRVFLFSGTCNNYEVVTTVGETACLTATDDGEEENDTCLTAVVPSANPLTGLFVSKSDRDYYGPYTINDMEQIDVSVLFTHADGDIDIRLLNTTNCTSSLASSGSVSDNEGFTFQNTSGSAISAVIEVIVWSGSASDCNNYDLDAVVSPLFDPCMVPDDSLEENDSCAAAAPVSEGSSAGLFVSKTDEDWYSIGVDNSETLDVSILFTHADGDMDLEIYVDCMGSAVDSSESVTDNESITWLNNTGSRANVLIRAFVWSGSSSDCNTYDLSVDLNAGSGADFVSFCFGDGSGLACPCMNDSASGSGGGCLNSAASSAVLAGSNSTSVAANDLRFDVSGATPSTFAVLVSGDNKLGGGLGVLGTPAADGLRCVGGGLLRHGTRSLDGTGSNIAPWGTGIGIIAGSGFVAGQTRHFQARYREDAMAGCGTGQNTSQGVSVTFAP